MDKFILSFFFSFLLSLFGFGQIKSLVVKDSFPHVVAKLSLDRLNQLYMVTKDDHHLLKLNEDMSLNQSLASPFLSPFIHLDVSDPMKILIFYPEYSSVQILDESLGLLSDDYYSDFNNESSICYFSTAQFCYFANNRIHLKNIQDLKVRSGEPIYYTKNTKYKINQIRSDAQWIYLLIPGSGIWIYNNFLIEEYKLTDEEITQMDVLNGHLYFVKSNQIYEWKPGKSTPKVVLSSKFEIIDFALNQNYLVLATPKKIKRYWIKK